MNSKTRTIFLNGMRDGLPIGFGYFAVSFSLGIIAKKAGLTPVMGFFSSLLIRASAGEYGAYTLIAADGGYLAIILMSLVTNLRYLLMSTALSQKFDEKTSLLKRILVGICITDEIFGISIAYPKKLAPAYTFGATFVAAPLWALGCFLGIIAGDILPVRIVSALSVALYGMFVAIIFPPAKKDKIILAAIVASFICSYLCSIMPVVATISSGTRTIILTVIISAIVAIIKPVSDKEEV